MAKQLFFKKEAKEKLLDGAIKVADAVGSTMGYSGRTVVISNHYNIPPVVTKDGVTVAQSIVLDDEIENIGAMMIKQASAKTASDAGDGTTQTAVLAKSMISNGINYPSNLKPHEIKKGLDDSINFVVDFVKNNANMINGDNNRLKEIATISANNDESIGSLIAEAYSKIGHDGLLMIDESGIIDTVIEVVNGVEIPRGYTTPFFVTDTKKMECVYENVLWLVTDYTLSKMDSFGHILNKIHEAGLFSNHALVVVAKDFEGEVHSSMMINHKNGVLKTCLIQAPSSYRNETLEDIATVTGATVIRDEAGLKIETMGIEHLGRSKKVVVSEKTTTIVDGNSNYSDLEDLKQAVKTQMEKMDNPDLKEVWRLRLARISSSMGVIKVGGSTDVEVRERKDRVDDACRAVRSAIEEGYVSGGGTILIKAANKLKSVSFLTESMEFGRDIVISACFAPLETMLDNADAEVSIINSVSSDERINFGYNAKTGDIEDLVYAGVIDPVKVIRCALQNSASVAGAIITSGCLVVEMQNK